MANLQSSFRLPTAFTIFAYMPERNCQKTITFKRKEQQIFKELITSLTYFFEYWFGALSLYLSLSLYVT